jgi:hypothetical protein
MCGDYAQMGQKECRNLCRQRGLRNGGSVTEMRVLLFEFDLGEHDDGGINSLLAEQATASPGRLKIIEAKLGAIKERDDRCLQLVAQWASLDETALCSKLLSDHGVTVDIHIDNKAGLLRLLGASIMRANVLRFMSAASGALATPPPSPQAPDMPLQNSSGNTPPPAKRHCRVKPAGGKENLAAGTKPLLVLPQAVQPMQPSVAGGGARVGLSSAMVFEASDQGIMGGQQRVDDGPTGGGGGSVSEVPDDAIPLSGMVLRSDVQPEGGLVVCPKVPDKAPEVTIALSIDTRVKRRYDQTSGAERRRRFLGVGGSIHGRRFIVAESHGEQSGPLQLQWG